MENKVYKCEYEGCGKIYKQNNSLIHHINSIHLNIKPFKCDICNIKFSLSYTLKRHQNTHLNIKPFKCSFENCNAMLSSLSSLKLHEKNHNGNKLYKCLYENCKKEFFTISHLNVHINIHSDERKYKCLYNNCEKTFKTIYYLNIHKQTHLNKRNYICTYQNCRMSFNLQIYLTNHIKTHNNERKYKCDFDNCDASYKLLSHLNIHKNRHLGIKNYKCVYLECDKKFTTSYELKKHTLTHNNRLYIYKCTFSVCNKTFTEFHNLNSHIKRHLGIKSHKCNYQTCDMSFVDSGDLKKHIRAIHTTPDYAKRQKKKEQNVNDFLISKQLVFNREHRLEFGSCIDTQEGKYCNIDFTLLTKNNCLLAIECDEYQHDGYPISCELRRMTDALTSILTGDFPLNGVHWIRFNPDSFKVDNKTTFYSINDRLNKLYQTIQDIQNNPPSCKMSITYLFYNKLDNELEITLDPEFPSDLDLNVYSYP